MMKLEEVNSPEMLLKFLDENIEYGVIDCRGNIINNSSTDKFQNACNNDWRLRPASEIIKSGVGHCYDQVEVERKWFIDNKYEFKTFLVSAYQKEIENSGFSHTYLVYLDKATKKWCLFEHSDYVNKGITKFNSIEEAIDFQSKNQIKYASSQIEPINKYSIYLKEFSQPPTNLNMEEYLDFIFKS